MSTVGLPIVGFVRHEFLPPSETFIYTSMRSLRRYDVRAFAVQRMSREKFPEGDVTALSELPLGALEALLYRATTVSPRMLRWARGVALIHAHLGQTGAHALLTARRCGLPLVTSFYGKDVTVRRTRLRLAPAYWHYAALAPLLFARGDRFLALSRHMRGALVEQGCPEGKIRIVPLGVDLSRFQPTARPVRARVRVLMVGREVEKKGFDDGLRACALARAAGADLEVMLLGTGSSGARPLRALADSLGLDVLWPAPSTPVPAAMSEADILLVPSRTARDGDQEGTPTVICEGASAGLPVVATLHAGIPEQVEHEATGLLAPERDVDGLAAHLVRLAREAELRRALGEAGRRKMLAEYSLEAHRGRLEAVYDELLGAPARREERARA
jgi:glycosyltransferase involved in cell wall biosynthesis